MTVPGTVNVLSPALQVWLNVIPAAALLLNAAAFALNAYQAKRTGRVTRATLVAAALKDFMTDADVQKAFYLIEYRKFKYGKDFHDSEVEQQIDKLLRLLANLAILWQTHVLSLKDLEPMQYYLVRVIGDADVQMYLKFMSEWTREVGVKHHPYEALSRLARTVT